MKLQQQQKQQKQQQQHHHCSSSLTANYLLKLMPNGCSCDICSWRTKHTLKWGCWRVDVDQNTRLLLTLVARANTVTTVKRHLQCFKDDCAVCWICSRAKTRAAVVTRV
jgi:hypothetical protein